MGEKYIESDKTMHLFELPKLAAKQYKTQKPEGKLHLDDVKWGDVYRFRVGDSNYPDNGGPGQWGIFRTMYFGEDGNVTAGDTFVAVVEFGKKLNAQVLLSYGNATQPGNKHIGDQLQLLSEKKLRPALLEKNMILSNLEKKETLGRLSKD